MESKKEIAKRIHKLTGLPKKDNFLIFDDLSDSMRMIRGSVVRLKKRKYVLLGYMREPRFGIDDQIKYWVLRAVDLETGGTKILKTVFREDFTVHIGILKIKCYRNMDKESAVLALTRGDDRYMQGETCYDSKGNNIRVLDFIKGKSFFYAIPTIEKDHEQYFKDDLPEILWKLFGSFKAIANLHDHGFCHGDIRNDHIIIESKTGKFRWIDFDLQQDMPDFDLWSLGNILNYSVAKGITTFKQVLKNSGVSAEIRNSLSPSDASAFYEYRIMNLGKLYSYIPEKLNNLLLHFTIKPIGFYTDIHEFLDEYQDMLESEFPVS
jgi:hypothetical protein